MKTLIAIPCMDTIPVKFAQCLLYMRKGENPTVYFKPNSLIYDSRNLISLYAIENGFDYVLWLDSDMMFPPETLIKLYYDTELLNVDMVTGLYVKRTEPITPVIYSHLDEPARNEDGHLVANIEPYMDYPRNDLFPVAGCGFGCCFTKTSLLKEVWDKFGPAFTPYPWAGEDISFCHRVNQLGHKIYCDSTVSCGHIGQFVYTEELLLKEGVKDIEQSQATDPNA